MKYLVTGITGFVGPHLANLLIERGNEVTGLVRASNGRENDIRDIVPDRNYSKIRFVYGDITDLTSIERIFKEEEFDGVFHLAAQSHPPTSFIDPAGTFKTNANGTINVVEAILRYRSKCKLMFCSTSEIYGVVPAGKGEIDENFPINPVNPYGVSKAAADLYVLERARSEKLPFFVTRAFSHTGPRRGHRFSVSSDAYQIARIKKGLQEPVIQVGTLSSKRVVMDVRDCVKAYYELMRKAIPGEAYNVAGNELFSMDQLLDQLLDINNLKGKVEKKINAHLVRPIDIPIQIPDSTKCRKLTGWEPKIPIRQTLADLLQYWNKKIT